MRSRAFGFIVGFVVTFGVPVVAVAQEPVRSFDQLNTRLKLGDTVWVIDTQGRQLKGKVRELSGTSLTIDSDGVKTFRAETVRTIKRPTGHRFLWGLTIGFAAGTVSWIALVALAGGDFSEAAGWEPFALGAIGAGIGAGMAATMPRKRLDVYRAPGTSIALSITPILTPRAKGLFLRVVF
jgi:hypothetical protein